MSFRCRPSWALVAALGAALAGCGTSEPDRAGRAAPAAPEGRTATPTPSARPDRDHEPVTAAEERVIRGWTDKLRHGDIEAAARYFSVPSRVSDATSAWVELKSRAQVRAFNRELPCGAKLIATRRSVDHFVVGILELTDRPGGACGAKGRRTAVAFRIRDEHITNWIRVDDSDPDEESRTILS